LKYREIFNRIFICSGVMTASYPEPEEWPYVPPGQAGPGQKWGLHSERIPLLGHSDTPELNSSRTGFTHFPFQQAYSYLSNTSKKLIFTRFIAS